MHSIYDDKFNDITASLLKKIITKQTRQIKRKLENLFETAVIDTHIMYISS